MGVLDKFLDTMMMISSMMMTMKMILKRRNRGEAFSAARERAMRMMKKMISKNFRQGRPGLLIPAVIK